MIKARDQLVSIEISVVDELTAPRFPAVVVVKGQSAFITFKPILFYFTLTSRGFPQDSKTFVDGRQLKPW